MPSASQPRRFFCVFSCSPLLLLDLVQGLFGRGPFLGAGPGPRGKRLSKTPIVPHVLISDDLFPGVYVQLERCQGPFSCTYTGGAGGRSRLFAVGSIASNNNPARRFFGHRDTRSSFGCPNGPMRGIGTGMCFRHRFSTKGSSPNKFDYICR